MNSPVRALLTPARSEAMKAASSWCSGWVGKNGLELNAREEEGEENDEEVRGGGG